MDIPETESVFNVLWQFAMWAALLHIIAMKVPQQPDSALKFIRSSLCVFPAFVVFLCWRRVSIAEGLCFVALFSVVFVHLLKRLLIKFSFVIALQMIYNVYFRHPGIPGSFWYMATDITYPLTIFTPKGYFQTPGLRKLQKLHAELGIFVHVVTNGRRCGTYTTESHQFQYCSGDRRHSRRADKIAKAGTICYHFWKRNQNPKPIQRNVSAPITELIF